VRLGFREGPVDDSDFAAAELLHAGNSNAAHQFLKPSFVMQRRPSRLDAETHEPRKAFLLGALQQFNRPCVIAKADLDEREPVRVDVPAAPTIDAEVRARVQALEQQIADLKRKEEAAAAYRAARVAGDSAAQRNAGAESRRLRDAMEQPAAELMEIRTAERLKQDEQNEALHARAIAQREASLAKRRFAHVSLNTNSGRALSRASKVVSVPGCRSRSRSRG